MTPKAHLRSFTIVFRHRWREQDSMWFERLWIDKRRRRWNHRSCVPPGREKEKKTLPLLHTAERPLNPAGGLLPVALITEAIYHQETLRLCARVCARVCVCVVQHAHMQLWLLLEAERCIIPLSHQHNGKLEETVNQAVGLLGGVGGESMICVIYWWTDGKYTFPLWLILSLNLFVTSLFLTQTHKHQRSSESGLIF